MACGVGLWRVGEGVGLRGEDWVVGKDTESGGILVIVIAVVSSVVGRCLF